MIRIENIDGYLADEAYPSSFHRQFAPPGIDAMLRHRGFATPRRGRAPFRLLDLGCGDGLGLIALAAAYPEAELVGVDAMAEHIDDGTTTAKRLGLANIRFDCLRFAEMPAPTVAEFDYVTGQGLLSWVTPGNRTRIFEIARDNVRPGGIACFGYNVLPGWEAVLAFQRTVRMFAEGGTGSAADRFDAAIERIRELSAAGAPAIPAAVVDWIDRLRATLPRGYFAHEYLNRNWGPLWSADVIEAMAAHGFAWLAPGRAERLRDDFFLTAAQRAELATIEDPPARELAADIFAHASFRVDIFGHGVARASDDERLDSWWVATVGEAAADYSCKTPAGRIRFDNEAAHAILAGLVAGPRTLRAIHDRGGAGTAADVLNAADALFVAGHILPVDPPGEAPAATAFNAEAAGRAGFGARVGAHGVVPAR